LLTFFHLPGRQLFFSNYSWILSLVDAQAGIGEIVHVSDRSTGLLNLAIGRLSGGSFFHAQAGSKM
jgi:hypothetical protein